MIPVIEDEHGLYLGIKPGHASGFSLKESNPNFDIFDTTDGQNRVIIGKCSRLPDDEDINAGRSGINFYRAKPGFPEAQEYHNAMTHPVKILYGLDNYAFAAATREEYDLKSKAWDAFYSYIWGAGPPALWMAPHAGTAHRTPDDLFPFPQLEMDAYTGRISALCALKNSGASSAKTVIAVHSYNWYSAILDLGGFGIIDEAKMAQAADKIENKYRRSVQSLARECKQYYHEKLMNWLDYIYKVRATLDPEKLKHSSQIDRAVVARITKGLNLYGKTLPDFTAEAFHHAFQDLEKDEIKVVSCGYIYPAKNIGKILGIKEKIRLGLIGSILQIECMKFYADKDPELITNIILDVKKELFG